jgi:tripartite-type tricarboxylate transporter receptor subunit TctC
VTSPTRVKALPNVPTMAEAGAPEYTLSNWWALAAAKNIPPSNAEWLEREFVAALKTPTLKARLEDIGFEIFGSTPEQFEERVRKESALYKGLVERRRLATQ